MNYLIEGLQGSGKSTLAARLAQLRGLRSVAEGDYSPIELAWCACLTESQYRDVLEQYPGLRSRIEAQTFPEGDRFVVCYTKVQTDDRAFYQDLERYEIYNGRLPSGDFQKLVLDRYGAWRGDRAVYECALFQNTVEDMILFRQASDGEIFDFYRRVRDALAGKPYQIVYLETADIRQSLDVVKRERTDEAGNPVWFDMLLGFFDGSPRAKARGLSGADALFAHLAHRQALELRLGRELFGDRFTVLPSKGYTDAALTALPD